MAFSFDDSFVFNHCANYEGTAGVWDEQRKKKLDLKIARTWDIWVLQCTHSISSPQHDPQPNHKTRTQSVISLPESPASETEIYTGDSRVLRLRLTVSGLHLANDKMYDWPHSPPPPLSIPLPAADKAASRTTLSRCRLLARHKSPSWYAEGGRFSR